MSFVVLAFGTNYHVVRIKASHSPPQLLWQELLPANWSGPIVIRSPAYLDHLRKLLLGYQNRVIHNALLLLFALNTLPPGRPSPLICAKATNWALPEVTSALFIGQYSEKVIQHAIHRVSAQCLNAI